MEPESTLVLTDEEGREYEFTLVDVIEVDGKEYAVLLPVKEDEEDLVILRYETAPDGTVTLANIEDDDEWERVAETWEASLFDDEGEDLEDEEE